MFWNMGTPVSIWPWSGPQDAARPDPALAAPISELQLPSGRREPSVLVSQHGAGFSHTAFILRKLLPLSSFLHTF